MKTKFFTLFLSLFVSAALSAQCLVQAISQPTGCGTPCTGSVNAFGNGTPPLAYVWMPGNYTTQNVPGLCAGMYTVTMTDASGCIATATTTVTSSSNLTAISTSQPSSTCNPCNGLGVVSVFGGTPPYTYNWAPSGGSGTTATGLCAGTYTMTATDAGGCTTSTTVTITQLNGPAITIVGSTLSSCSSCTGTAQALATLVSPPFVYQWSPSGGTNATATGLCPGNYTVCVTASTGCSTCTTVTISCTVGLNDEKLEADVNLFPNPATDEISISLNEEMSDVSVVMYNIVGEVIGSTKFNFSTGKKFKMDISHLSEGIYFIELRKGNMTIKKKFVKG